ncbi:MAG: hypothetical protein ABIS51_19100 [Sphingomonas sp.]
MKIRIIKADFALLLNQASLLFAPPFPVIAAAFPCSALSLPCYRITAKTLYKLLIVKDNKSNKSPENREEKISFPVLSLFLPINRESGGTLSAARAGHSINARRALVARTELHSEGEARWPRTAPVRMPRIYPSPTIGQTAATRAMPG